MTFNTSEVAVCCSSDSERSSVRCRNSLSSRVFSMAITACAAKFWEQRNLLFAKSARLPAKNDEGADQRIIVQQRDSEQAARAVLFDFSATHTGTRFTYAASCVASATWTTAFVAMMRPSMLSGCGENGSCIIATSLGLAPRRAPIANFCPSQRYRNPKLASQMRTAFSSIDSNTGLRFARRRTDDLQHLARGGLLLQRFGQIVGALAQFVEQPRVLDGDDRLRGEVLHQLDLLVDKWPDFCAIDGDNADRFIVLEQGHRNHGTEAGNLDSRNGQRVARQIGRLARRSACCAGWRVWTARADGTSGSGLNSVPRRHCSM